MEVEVDTRMRHKEQVEFEPTELNKKNKLNKLQGDHEEVIEEERNDNKDNQENQDNEDYMHQPAETEHYRKNNLKNSKF
jgi:hypothetical protein